MSSSSCFTAENCIIDCCFYRRSIILLVKAVFDILGPDFGGLSYKVGSPNIMFVDK
jgi:hypothetical protein